MRHYQDVIESTENLITYYPLRLVVRTAIVTLSYTGAWRRGDKGDMPLPPEIPMLKNRVFGQHIIAIVITIYVFSFWGFRPTRSLRLCPWIPLLRFVPFRSKFLAGYTDTFKLLFSSLLPSFPHKRATSLVGFTADAYWISDCWFHPSLLTIFFFLLLFLLGRPSFKKPNAQYIPPTPTRRNCFVASASAVWAQFATSSRRLPTDSVDNLEIGQTDSTAVWLCEFW